jgi:hypothetical protein
MAASVADPREFRPSGHLTLVQQTALTGITFGSTWIEALLT